MKVPSRFKHIFLLYVGVGMVLLQAQSASEAIHILEGEIGFGTRALGMGGAFTAISNDHSALYWNPAGLATIPQAGISAEISNLSFTNRVTYIGDETVTKDNFLRGNGNNYVIPLPTVRGSFVIAIGWNRILHYDESMAFSGFSSADNGLEFPIISGGEEQLYPFSRDIFRKEDVGSTGGVNQISIGAGIALTPQVTVGFSLSRTTGTESYTFSFRQEDSQNKYTEYPGNFDSYILYQDLQANLQAWNLKLGLMVAPTRFSRMGMSLSLPSTFEVSESYRSREQLYFDDGFNTDTTLSGYWEYKVRTPVYLDGGFSVTVKGLTTGLSFRFRDWSATRFDVKGLSTESDIYQNHSTENVILATEYRATMEFHAGAEYVFKIGKKLGIRIRGGYAHYPGPKKEQGGDRSLFTAGLGIPIFKRIDLETAWLRGNQQRTSRDSYTPEGAKENITTTQALVMLAVRL